MAPTEEIHIDLIDWLIVFLARETAALQNDRSCEETANSPRDDDAADDHWSPSRLSTADNTSDSSNSFISVSPISVTNVGIKSSQHTHTYALRTAGRWLDPIGKRFDCRCIWSAILHIFDRNNNIKTKQHNEASQLSVYRLQILVRDASKIR